MGMRTWLLVVVGLAVAGLVGAGLVPPDSPIPGPGEAGAPHTALDAEDQAAFLRGRALFDKDFLMKAGVGPMFNGDSCRACHVAICCWSIYGKIPRRSYTLPM